MKVIGTEMYTEGLDQLMQELIDDLQRQPKNHCISPSDANVLVEARRNPDFRAILHQFNWNLPDGMPSVWILRRKGAKNATRCAGPDLFEQFIKKTSNSSCNHFLLGGAEGIAEQLKATCEKWGNHQITGTFTPPFLSHEEMDYSEMAKTIDASKANIVWIGLGAPKQIYVAHELAKRTNVHFLITVGAAFDFHTGKVKKAPKWLQKIGMEWFYRMLKDPKRLFKRYFRVVPQFIWFAMVDSLRGRK